MCLLALAIAAAFLVGLGDVEASFPALGALEGLAVPMGLIAPLIVVAAKQQLIVGNAPLP